jgi:hypothetical protein
MFWSQTEDRSHPTSAIVVQDNSTSKHCKSLEEGTEENSGKAKAVQSSNKNDGKKQGKNSSSKPVPNPHQDFIHV